VVVAIAATVGLFASKGAGPREVVTEPGEHVEVYGTGADQNGGPCRSLMIPLRQAQTINSPRGSRMASTRTARGDPWYARPANRERPRRDRRMSRKLMLVSATAMAAGYTTMHVLGRCAGSTAYERAARLPGDDLVHDPQMVMNHGITIEARAEDIWPWLTQMGWHLGGYYTPHWVDKLLFPENWESLEQLDPQLVRDLRIGDVIPDGRPGTAYFRVALVERPALLVLRSQTHLPPTWSENYDARITWTWTFHLTELPDDSTRVHLRVRGLRHVHRDVEGPEETHRRAGRPTVVGP
jgi:hypothetical protein